MNWTALEEMASRPRWTNDEAEQLLAAWRKSGIEIEAFANRVGVQRQRFRRWQARAGEAELRFLPVRVRSQPENNGSPGGMIVRSPGGWSVSFEGGNVPSVSEVLEAMSAADRC